MGSNQTGLKPEEVNSAIDQALNSGNDVMNALEAGFKGILESLKSNWGTQDGKTWVEGPCCTEMDSIATKVAENLSKIGEVISAVGNAQIKDTSNAQACKAASPVGTKKVTGFQMNDKLSNGYIGVYSELLEDLKTKEDECLTKVDEKIGELQTRVIAKTDVAFNKVGAADKVSAECTIYINRVKTTISQGLTSLNTAITTNTSKADEFVKSIQDAGLRGANGGN